MTARCEGEIRVRLPGSTGGPSRGTSAVGRPQNPDIALQLPCRPRRATTVVNHTEIARCAVELQVAVNFWLEINTAPPG